MEQRPEETIPFPKGVYYIVFNYSVERFSYYSIRTILFMYFLDILVIAKKKIKFLYSLFSLLVLSSSIVGAFFGDSRVGKYNSLIYISLIELCGVGILSMSSLSATKKPDAAVTYCSLALALISSGAIRPLIPALGGDQFVLPEQLKEVSFFFALYFFFWNFGIVVSAFVTPELRNLPCLGKTTCYPLAFGAPVIMLVVALVALIVGKPSIYPGKQSHNTMMRICRIIKFALKEKRKTRGPPLDHWLDYAKEKYGSTLIEDLKYIPNILILFSPLMFNWMVYILQEHSSEVQASQMNGYIGFYTLSANQMVMATPFFTLIEIPLFYYIIYPLLQKKNWLTTPCQKIVAGGYLTALTCLFSGIVASILVKEYPIVPGKGMTQLTLYNTNPCDVKITCANLAATPFEVRSGARFTQQNIPLTSPDGFVTWNYEISGDCVPARKTSIDLYEEKAVGQYYTPNETHIFVDYVRKSTSGMPKIRSLINCNGFRDVVPIDYVNSLGQVTLSTSSNKTATYMIRFGEYKISIAGREVMKATFEQGGVYTLLGYATSATTFKVFLHVITSPNDVSMLWLIPQYVIQAAGEVMVTLTALEFLYVEAPEAMKTIVLAYWSILGCGGEFISSMLNLNFEIENQPLVKFGCAAVQVLAISLFAFFAIPYKYRTKRFVTG